MSEEDYNKRDGTYRKYKEQQKAASGVEPKEPEEQPSNIKVGSYRARWFSTK